MYPWPLKGLFKLTNANNREGKRREGKSKG